MVCMYCMGNHASNRCAINYREQAIKPLKDIQRRSEQMSRAHQSRTPAKAVSPPPPPKAPQSSSQSSGSGNYTATSVSSGSSSADTSLTGSQVAGVMIVGGIILGLVSACGALTTSVKNHQKARTETAIRKNQAALNKKYPSIALTRNAQNGALYFINDKETSVALTKSLAACEKAGDPCVPLLATPAGTPKCVRYNKGLVHSVDEFSLLPQKTVYGTSYIRCNYALDKELASRIKKNSAFSASVTLYNKDRDYLISVSKKHDEYKAEFSSKQLQLTGITPYPAVIGYKDKLNFHMLAAPTRQTIEGIIANYCQSNFQNNACQGVLLLDGTKPGCIYRTHSGQIGISDKKPVTLSPRSYTCNFK